MPWRWIGIVVGMAVVCGARPVAAQVFVVKDGRPRADIVIAHKPTRSVKLAANDLRHYLAKITGATLPVVAEPTAAHPVHVYVGTSAHTQRLGISNEGLLYGAFRMVSGSDWLALVGRDDDYVPITPSIMTRPQGHAANRWWQQKTGEPWLYPGIGHFKIYNRKLDTWLRDQAGSAFAVYAFLRTLGVRWYMPGELGEVVPRRTSVALPQVDRTVRPEFDYRWLHFAQFSADPDAVLWFRRIGLDASKRVRFGHGLYKLLRPEAMKKAHPENYAIMNGQRDFVGCKRCGRPCLSEPLFRATMKYLHAFFDTYPQETMYPVMPPDSYSSMCQGDCCKGQATPERGWDGKMSDYVWGFVNRVAIAIDKTHPGKMIACCAYGTYRQPPQKIALLHKNVVVVHCQHRSADYDPAARRQRVGLRRAWLAKLASKQYYIWDYYLYSTPKRLPGIPPVFPHLIARDLRDLAGHCKGEFIEGAKTLPHKMAAPGINHLNYYVTARLYWDAKRDVDALIDEYCRMFFGPAAPDMKAFYAFAESVWTRNKRRTTDGKGFLQSADVERYFALLNEARAKAGDTVYGQRIDVILTDCEPMKLLAKQLAKPRDVRTGTALHRDGVPIRLDGRLDDGFWKGTPRYRLYDVVTGKRPTVGTDFRLAWAGDTLYVGITCHEPAMKTLRMSATGKDDTNIWRDDTVELLIETLEHSYYQLAVNPAGALVDMDRVKGVFEGIGWDSGARVAATRGADRWTIEWGVPLANVKGKRPTPTYPWFFNLCRSRPRDAGTDLSAFSHTGKRAFHVTRRFARLRVR